MADTERIENEEAGELDEVIEETPWDAVLNESETPDDEDVEEEESLEGKSPEERLAILEERVTSRNRTLRQREKAISRMQEEISELRTSGEKAEITPEMIAAIRGEKQEKAAPQPLITDDERDRLNDQFAENPSTMVEFMHNKVGEMVAGLEDKVVEALQRRDAVLENKMKPPVAPEIKQAVERLKQDPEFAGMDDSVLEVVARKTLPALKRSARPPASINGRPASAKGGGAKAQKNSLLEKLGY